VTAGGRPLCGSTTRHRGIELQVDFGKMSLVPDGERRRVCEALIFTCVYSRHVFVWLTFPQTTKDVIAGFEAAWEFFGGLFPVIIPDDMTSIVTEAEDTAPRFNDVFQEYAPVTGLPDRRRPRGNPDR
jgi:transposase